MYQIHVCATWVSEFRAPQSKRGTEWLERQQQRDTKMMTSTSPFTPQPLCDSDDSICGYQTYSTKGPKTAGENITQNHSIWKPKWIPEKQNNYSVLGKKGQQTKKRVHCAAQRSVFYGGL